MNRFVVLLFAAAVFCGCASVERQSKEPNLLTTVNGVDLSRYELKYSVQPWLRGCLPVPLDNLMLFVRQHSGGKAVSFEVVPDDSLVTEFNAYAAKEIAAGKPYDPRAERAKFILDKCGEKSAPYMTEYFRLQERYTMFVFSCSGLLYPKSPLYKDLCSKDQLDQLQKYLEKAVEAAKGTRFAPVLAKEYEFFLKSRREVETLIAQGTRRFVIGDNGAGFQQMAGILGDEPVRASEVLCSVSPDKKYFVIRVKADEPMMKKRRITGTGRDYSAAWKDDRFEIFIVPDRAKPECSYQFIITSGGVLWDASRKDLSYNCDLSWNSASELKVVHHPASWEAELRIPLAALGYSGVPDKDFLFNIYRFREVKGAKLEKYAWSPICHGANFQPENFGVISWED